MAANNSSPGPVTNHNNAANHGALQHSGLAPDAYPSQVLANMVGNGGGESPYHALNNPHHANNRPLIVNANPTAAHQGVVGMPASAMNAAVIQAVGGGAGGGITAGGGPPPSVSSAPLAAHQLNSAAAAVAAAAAAAAASSRGLAVAHHLAMPPHAYHMPSSADVASKAANIVVPHVSSIGTLGKHAVQAPAPTIVLQNGLAVPVVAPQACMPGPLANTLQQIQYHHHHHHHNPRAAAATAAAAAAAPKQNQNSNDDDDDDNNNNEKSQSKNNDGDDGDDKFAATNSPVLDYNTSVPQTLIMHTYPMTTDGANYDSRHHPAAVVVQEDEPEQFGMMWHTVVEMENDDDEAALKCLNDLDLTEPERKRLFKHRNNTGRTILMEALKRKHTKIASMLVKQGANLDDYSLAGCHVLGFAAEAGNLEIAEHVLDAKLCDVNYQTPLKGFSALMMASQNGHYAVVESLINHGAIVNLQTKAESWTALMMASQNGHCEVVERLLAAQALVNIQTKDKGRTALTKAAHNGHTDVIEKLIAAGAHVNHQLMFTGQTALIKAAQNGHLQVVLKLLAAGAHVNLQTKDQGCTALFVAASGGFESVVEALISAGANVNLQTKTEGWSPLMKAAEMGHLRVVEQLIDAGALLNLQTKMDGWTALMMAANNDHMAVVERLISAGAQSHVVAHNGLTASAVAMQRGHEEMVDSIATYRKSRRIYVQVQSRGDNGIAEELHFPASGTFQQLQDEVWQNLDDDEKTSSASSLKLARPGHTDVGEPPVIRLRNDRQVQALRHGDRIVVLL